MKGAECARFLQGLGTNNFEVRSGVTFLTAFCNAKGVCLDYARVLYTGEEYRFICQPSSRADTLLSLFQEFLFPLDKVTVKDESSSATLYQLIGMDEYNSSNSDEVVQREFANGTVYEFSEWDSPIPTKSLLVLLEEGHEASTAGVIELRDGYRHVQGQLSKEIAEQLRRVKGRPFVNVDMEPYNITALEAGLMRAVHFRKGCFVGNEILSKQVLTNSIRKHLVGLRCTHDVAQGAKLVERESGDVVGFVSSGTIPLSEEISSLLSEEERRRWGDMAPALAYVKTKLAQKGTSLQVIGLDSAEAEAEVELLPFPHFSVSASPAPPVEKVKTRGKEVRVDLERAIPREGEDATSGGGDSRGKRD